MLTRHPLIGALLALALGLAVYVGRGLEAYPDLMVPLLGAAPSFFHAIAIVLALRWADPQLGAARLLVTAAGFVVALELAQASAIPVAGRGTLDRLDLLAALGGVALAVAAASSTLTRRAT